MPVRITSAVSALSVLGVCAVYAGSAGCSSDDATGALEHRRRHDRWRGRTTRTGLTDSPSSVDGADAADGAPTKVSLVNVTSVNVTVMGDTRLYVLSVPKTYDASKKYPLIVALHGDGDKCANFQATIGLDDVTGSDAITAYTDQVIDLFTAYAQNEDQQLVQATIVDVSSKFTIDATKIWGFGYSKGGFQVNQISCVHPGVFTAFAAHATGAPSVSSDQCPGIVGLPVLTQNGTNDPDIGAEAAAEYWGQVNGCGTTRTTITPAACAVVRRVAPRRSRSFIAWPRVSRITRYGRRPPR